MRRLVVGVGAAAVMALTLGPGIAEATPGLTICTGTLTGASLGSVSVPAGAACTLVNSKVEHNVTAESGSYLELDSTAVGGAVKGLSAQTVFVNTGSSVTGLVSASSTGQLFVFDAKVGGVSSSGATQTAQVCATTVSPGNILITGGEDEVLLGDPLGNCAGNTVSTGSIRVTKNRISQDLIVDGNTVSAGNLQVAQNVGLGLKIVEHNSGGNVLECVGNALPFAGDNNSPWAHFSGGQCT